MGTQTKIAEKTNFEGLKVKSSTISDKGHGGIEVRKYYLVEDIDWLPMKENWKGLRSIGMAIRECEVKGVKTIVFIKGFCRRVWCRSKETLGNRINSLVS